MKKAIVLLTALAPSIVLAGYLGTRGEATAAPATAGGSPVGFGSIVQMAIALCVVLALVKYVLPKFVGRLNNRMVPALGSTIRVEESAAFAGGNLYIVNARGKALLISATSTGVTMLADLTDAPPEPDIKTFDEILQVAEPSRATEPEPVQLSHALVSQESDPAKQALDRLQRLLTEKA